MSMLVIEPINGLCNRLRAIASGWILAKHLNRQFRLYWRSTEDIGFAKFTDLFENDELLINDDELKIECDKGCTVYSAGIQTEIALIPLICKDSSKTILLKQSGGNYIPPYVSLGKFNTLKSQFYNTLKPVAHVINCVNRFTNIGECLGVHIRRTDRKNFTPSTDIFALAIKRRLANKPYSQIFLCTDDESVIKELEMLVTNKIELILYNKQRFARDSPESVQDALIDWLLLSKCDNIIFSHGSSFGYEACIRGTVKNALELRTKREKSENEKRNLPELTFNF